MAALTDIALVAQVALMGNKRAFDQLVSRYQSPVRRFFLHQTLGDSDLSDDLAQDTFIKAYVNIGQFRGLSSFQTWLMRIAYRVFFDYVRANSSRHFVQESDALKALPASERVAADCALRTDIYSALALLRPDERSCITLQLIDGYDVRQIARITGMKEGTVKSHLSRGKERMAEYLRRNGYGK